ncbi:MAG: formylglycine-generating enzyme family protein, partial [Magnetococcales bacterium]|nr:formylglycine-generating enzyme family protein [Magnetococcales bacterium]
GTGFQKPSATPAPTMYDINTIVSKMPKANNTDGAVPANVCSGKTFWSVRTDGSWGPQTGIRDCSADPEFNTFTNDLGMTFNKIPAGTFQMGCENSDGTSGIACESNEGPIHTVIISNPYYMQSTEITQGQWQAVMGNNPSRYISCGIDCPVNRVTWNEVQIFITEMNKRGEGTYRLPTEAEWEYAARAWTTTARYYGDGNAMLDDYAWSRNNSSLTLHKVALKLPNAFGLYDMLGNVWEWVQDHYKSDYYINSPKQDPQGPNSGTYRVIRGGSLDDDVKIFRAAFRARNLADFRNDGSGGARLVRITP